MDALIGNLKAYLKTVPRNKLYLYLMVLVAAVGGSVIGLSFLQKEDYQPLFTGLSTEDASMVVAKLKEQKVPYRLGVNGTTISVPKEKVYDVRLLLASQNSLPGASGVGMELFDKTNYGMTEFMQTINYKRAIQGELTRTINQMPEIRASRVHIAIPEKTLFTEKEKETTASIFLKLKPGRELSEGAGKRHGAACGGQHRGAEGRERGGHRLLREGSFTRAAIRIPLSTCPVRNTSCRGTWKRRSRSRSSRCSRPSS